MPSKKIVRYLFLLSLGSIFAPKSKNRLHPAKQNEIVLLSPALFFCSQIIVSMKRLIVFDLDGTLLNTIEDLAASTNYALAQCGYPAHDVDEYRYFVGNGIDKLFERALPSEVRSAEEVARMRSFFLPYYDAHNAVHTKPYAGIVELLGCLQAERVAMAVVSNKYQAATVKLIATYFPDIHFVAVLGQRQGVAKKPAPSAVNEVLSLSGTARRDALYVGDSGVDMETARNAGIESVGVTWGFRPEEELRQAGANHVVHTPALLWQCVKGKDCF